MRPHKPREWSKAGFNMTPLIDMVFNLLIFALLISQFAELERVRLPRADQAREGKEASPSVVVITVPGKDIVIVRRELHRLPEVGEVLRQELAKNPKLSVQIRGDENVDYATVQKVMFECAQVGIWQLSFTVARDKGSGGKE